MYIQRCRYAPEHTHIHVLIQTLMYAEVWNIMVCNQNVPDPNQHERTLDVVRERPWRLSFSWEHIVDRRERRRHSHARTDADTHTHMCTHTDMAFAHAHAHTQTHARTRRHTCTHARTHVYTHAHTPRQTRTHTHARTQTHTRTRTPARRYTHDTCGGGGVTPPRVRQPGKGETVQVGQKR